MMLFYFVKPVLVLLLIFIVLGLLFQSAKLFEIIVGRIIVLFFFLGSIAFFLLGFRKLFGE